MDVDLDPETLRQMKKLENEKKDDSPAKKADADEEDDDDEDSDDLDKMLERRRDSLKGPNLRKG